MKKIKEIKSLGVNEILTTNIKISALREKYNNKKQGESWGR